MGLRGPYEYFHERIGPTADPAIYPDAPMGGDADRDGIPRDWELTHNLDPDNPDDANNIVPPEVSQRHAGYTYIEYYLNELADNITGVSGPVYTIQTNVSPVDTGTVLPQHGVYGQELFAYGGYNAPYWFGKIDFGTAEYNEGSIVIMKAKPKPGYVFDLWSGGAVDGLTATQVSFPATEDTIITAHFRSAQKYTVSVEILPNGVGDVAGKGDYNEDQVVTLAAYSTDTGKIFEKWLVTSRGSGEAFDQHPIHEKANPVVQFAAEETITVQAMFKDPDPVLDPGNSGGDVLIDDFPPGEIPETGDPDNISYLDGKRWFVGADRVLFHNLTPGITPGNFSLTDGSRRYSHLSLGNAEDPVSNIPDGVTVLKMKIYNIGGNQARMSFRSSREGGIHGDSGPENMSFQMGPSNARWGVSPWYSDPLRFPVIEAGDSAMIEIPLALLKNKNLTSIVKPADQLRSFSFSFFLIRELWGSQIAIDDVAFGRAQSDPITATNLPPTAHAGRDQITKDADNNGIETVLLNGLKSCDQDAGLIANWQWSWTDPIDGPKTAEGFAPTVVLPVKRNSEPYDITLTITDEGDLTDTDIVQIIVLASDEEPPLDGILGDVNRDEQVNMIDAILVAKAVVGIGSVNTGLADVDKSGTVTLKDALLIAQYVNGVITEFPEP